MRTYISCFRSERERANPYKIISLLNRKSRAQRVYALAHAAVSGVQNIYTYLIWKHFLFLSMVLVISDVNFSCHLTDAPLRPCKHIYCVNFLTLFREHESIHLSNTHFYEKEKKKKKTPSEKSEQTNTHTEVSKWWKAKQQQWLDF